MCTSTAAKGAVNCTSTDSIHASATILTLNPDLGSCRAGAIYHAIGLTSDSLSCLITTLTMTLSAWHACMHAYTYVYMTQCLAYVHDLSLKRSLQKTLSDRQSWNMRWWMLGCM